MDAPKLLTMAMMRHRYQSWPAETASCRYWLQSMEMLP
jgi:hypothetical protein